MSISDKRHTIKLEALTPIHIGSGAFLQNNVEFVRSDRSLYIIDPQKLLSIIGIDNLDNWVKAIENGDDITEFIKGMNIEAHPSKYSRREIKFDCNTQLFEQTTLKVCMHDARDLAYIPGSSIKGAIRTAIFNAIASKKYINANSINTKSKKFACQGPEKYLFGKSPNSSIFRFIQVGDAYFPAGCEVTLNEVNLNIRKKTEELLDKKKQQLVEAIGKGYEAQFSIKILNEYNSFAYKESLERDKITDNARYKTELKKLPYCITSIEGLLGTINKYTERLIKEEIEIWEKNMCEHNDDATAKAYVESMKKILDEVRKCGKGQCILRLGQASGWRFTTGAWTEGLSIFKSTIVPMARPKNKENNYEMYDFPKTRRIGEGSDNILGFVKLTIVE